MFGPVSPPYRWDSSESAAQTSVQMDQGHSPRTLRGLGVRLARHGLKAKSEGNGNDGRGAQVSRGLSLPGFSDDICRFFRS